MILPDLLTRSVPPIPWQEADNIPWHEPGFSARMLREHLSQDHDAASRRAATIDRQIAWLDRTLLQSRPTRVLDLGCGPGLYTSRLARLGHTCVGIDYSPASIAYAQAAANEQGLSCQYQHEDLREADFGHGFGLAMLIFGELNVFPRAVAAQLLGKVHQALDPGCLLLLEPHTADAVRQMGERPAVWYARERGLFGESPYLCLQEHFWDADRDAATTRYFIIDLATAAVARYAQSAQAYSEEAYTALLTECGFVDLVRYPALTGDPVAEQPDLCVLVARKG